VLLVGANASPITGLAEVLERYRVDGWLDNGRIHDDALYAQCMARIEEGAVTRQVVRAGDRLETGSGIVLEVLHPGPELMAAGENAANNNSLVLRLVWGQASFLFTADIEAEAERLLLASGQVLSSGVLKVAHHGSGGSCSAEFLSAVDPAYAVISVGADNRFGHPQEAMLDRLGQMGEVEILRTDEQGTIEFVTDGQRLWLQTER
jgi:competence protein ComEC